MDAAEALTVVRALADGRDPQSGAPLAPESVFQQPEVIRALFTAATALEHAASSPPRPAARGRTKRSASSSSNSTRGFLPPTSRTNTAARAARSSRAWSSSAKSRRAKRLRRQQRQDRCRTRASNLTTAFRSEPRASAALVRARARRAQQASDASRAARARSAATLGAERRARGVGGKERSDAQRVSAEGFARGCSRSAHSPERSARREWKPARAGTKAAPSVQATERSGTTRGVQQSGAGRAACYWPAGSPPRGFRGEPAVSRSEGPCGPSERDVGARAEAGASSAAPRRPAAFVLEAVEARREPMGAAGSPPG